MIKKVTLLLALVASSACGGPCTPFANDSLSYGRCEFAETQCEERCGSRGVQFFYCLPPTGAQTSITCSCGCKTPWTVPPSNRNP